MSTTSIGSPMLKARTPLLLDLPDHAWFDVELMQKDIRLARRAAAELETPLPSATVADQVLTEARHLGYGHRDLAALHDVLAKTTSRSFGGERTRAEEPDPARHGAPAARARLSRRATSRGDTGEARHA